MDQKEKLEAATIRAKARWRRLCGRPEATAAERREALAAWRKAQLARDRLLLILRKAPTDRRNVRADRRKAAGGRDGVRSHEERRVASRRR